MAARAIWKGILEIGGTEVPVKLYSAVTDHSVRFRLLDAKKKEPVRQRMIDPDTGDVVEHSDVKRAMELGGGTLVILSGEELEELEPKESREIEITRFLKSGSISPEWYDRPYYLGPDGDAEAYASLAEALRKRDREGVARWVMRGKEYVGVLRLHDEFLVLITIHHASEVIPASRLEPPAGREMNAKEVRMAKQLIEAMVDDLDLSAFRDEYRDRVMELVEAKAAGKVVKFPRAPRRKTEKPLTDVLEKSLKAVQKEKKSA